jgi:hypothetical protein
VSVPLSEFELIPALIATNANSGATIPVTHSIDAVTVALRDVPTGSSSVSPNTAAHENTPVVPNSPQKLTIGGLGVFDINEPEKKEFRPSAEVLLFLSEEDPRSLIADMTAVDLVQMYRELMRLGSMSSTFAEEAFMTLAENLTSK